MSTLDGFHAAFFTLHRRFPSKQEIFDEGVREGKSRATPADHISQARDAVIEECAAAIKAEDDRMSEDDYMLDSDDCIRVIRALKSAPPEKPAGDVSDS